MTDFINGMRPIHPGEVLREEFLIPFGLSAHALAIALQVPAPRINIETGSGKTTGFHEETRRTRSNNGSSCRFTNSVPYNIVRAVTPDTALRLSAYFGVSAEFWMGNFHNPMQSAG